MSDSQQFDHEKAEKVDDTNDDVFETFKTEYLEEYEFVEVEDFFLQSPESTSNEIIEDSTAALIDEVDEFDNIKEENEDNMKIDKEFDQSQSKIEPSPLYHCLTCDTNFSSTSDHIKEFHFGEEIIIQSDDEDNNIINNIPKDKITIKLEENRFQCEICKKYLKSLQTLKNHQIKQHYNNKILLANEQEIVTNLTCSICLTEFMSEKSLKLHARMHNSNVRLKTMDDIKAELGAPTSSLSLSKKFFCKICDKTYDFSLKNIHMQMHNDENGNVCPVCNKHFAKAEHLKIHEITHTSLKPATAAQLITEQNTKELNANDKKLKYRCQYCNYGFGRPHEKVKHERIHTGEKPYACEVCGKTFRVVYCLTLHMRTHTNERPYICQICKKGFKSNSVYNHHLLTHSDARTYQCPECPKAFKTAVQLCGHRNSHSKPFSCTDCKRKFATLYAVRNHMESHKKPNHNLKHSCDICGATYARGFALKDHINEEHPGAELPMDKISKKTESSKEQKIIFDDDVNNAETEEAEQSILPVDGSSIEIYSDIDQFATEEVITDWLR